LSYLLNLQKYYPGEIEITSKYEVSRKIIIELKSRTKNKNVPSADMNLVIIIAHINVKLLIYRSSVNRFFFWSPHISIIAIMLTVNRKYFVKN